MIDFTGPRVRVLAMRFSRLALVLLSAACFLPGGLALSTGRAGPVSFAFTPDKPAPTIESAFARALFAEVATPSGTIRIPAFFAGRNRWEVRVRGDRAGAYTLQRIVEVTADSEQEIPVTFRSRTTRTLRRTGARLAVTRDAQDPERFAYLDGTHYTPIGANLAWAAGPRVRWHLQSFKQFAAHDLNWTRIWMCHWGGTNLDWLPEDMGRSPEPGSLDLRVARHWDRILDGAEKRSVYVQVVLQHHGQYTTGANSNWAINPWNVAQPGGFLARPADFFTDPRAIALTRQKYRYIVARWSHSPAVLAWELFNEVHWTNGYVDDEPAVAAWHADMARYIRSIDPYRHLVTTSLDDLGSPIYAEMDYFQPHLYAINMLTGVREYERPFGTFDRPVFYGEIGDDKLRVSGAEKAGGSQLIPQVWASLMGPGPIPGQSWLGETFLRTRRVGELGAVARYLHETGLAARPGLQSFVPGVESTDTLPLRVTPGYDWARHRPATAELALDGRDDLSLNRIPGILVGSPGSVADGYLASFEWVLDVPRRTQVVLSVADAGARGAELLVQVDGSTVASHHWPALPGAPATGHQPEGIPPRPANLTFPLEPGLRRLRLSNTGGADWVQLDEIAFDLRVPVLAAAGKRDDAFIALWVWNKQGVHALEPATAASATLVLADVVAGRWRITWWDADRGVPGKPVLVDHPGGALQFATPAIERHAAVVLTRD